jgi:hypothetical protein
VSANNIMGQPSTVLMDLGKGEALAQNLDIAQGIIN